MATFAIIYGKQLMVKEFRDDYHSKMYCENYLDQSKEIIIRRIKSISINEVNF